MKGFAWLLVALNALVFLAGVSGALGALPFFAPERPAALEGSAADGAPGVRRIVLLGESSGPVPREAAAGPRRPEPTPAPDEPPRQAGPDAAVVRDGAGAAEPKTRLSPPPGGEAPAALAPAGAAAPEPEPGMAPDPTPRELEAPTALAPADTAASASAAQAFACLEAGPFGTSEGATEAAVQAVRAAGGQVLDRELRASGRVRHWVLMEGFPTRDAALREQDRLYEAGFTDVLPVETPAGWGLSLGLFAERERAQAHRDAVQAAGFAATVAERRSGPEQMWLRVSVPSQARDALARALPAGAGLAPCAAAGHAGPGPEGGAPGSGRTPAR